MKWFNIVLVALLGGFLATGCGEKKENDEAMVRQAVQQCLESVQKLDFSALPPLCSKSMQKEMAEEISDMEDHSSMVKTMTFEVGKVVVDGNNASCEAFFIVSSERDDGEFELVKEDGKWLISDWPF